MSTELNVTSSEIKAYIKVCTPLGQKSAEIVDNINNRNLSWPLSRVSIFRWIAHFKKGKSDIPDDRGKTRHEEIQQTKKLTL